MRDTPASPPRLVLGMPAHQLDLQAFVQFVLECTLDSRVTAEAVRATFPRDGGPDTFERLLLRTGLMDRLKLQTLELKNRIDPILARRACRAGAAAAWTRSIPTRRFSSTGISTACPTRS